MKNKLYLQFIRILAFTCVIYNHTGQYGYELFTVTSNKFIQIICIILSNLCKIGVPLFFMISGALLIPKKEDIKTLLIKRVLRISIILILVSFIYYIRLYIKHPEYGFSIVYFFKMIYTSPFITPFWFLYSYIAFLLILPFLRSATENMVEKDYIFIIALALIYNIIVPIGNFIMEGNICLSIPIMSNIILFPITGYYLDSIFDSDKPLIKTKQYPFYKKNPVILAIGLTIINSFLCLLLTYADFLKNDQWSFFHIENLFFIPAVSTFFLTKRFFKTSTKPLFIRKIISYWGNCIFIIYLFEEILREDICMNIYKNCNTENPLLLFIPYLLSLFSLGVIIASIIHIIKKFVVKHFFNRST
ncbi:MAG: acyltransferase [Lachnospiraceae bacterium]|nr:acyltransferase [Lachnospiraceae bacterium]